MMTVATTLSEDEVRILEDTAKQLKTTKSAVIRSMLRFVIEHPDVLKEFAEEIENDNE
jgi:hypothetical protein